jgi:hypothetical protein
MSHQEKMSFIKSFRIAIQSYKGFTYSEKLYGVNHIDNWIGKDGNLDIFVEKFSERSLDVHPFLAEARLSR